MDFGFSEEQQDVQKLARQILQDLSTSERLAAYDNYASERFDAQLWGKLAEAGLLGVAVDEEHGGMGFGYMEVALIAEEIGRTIAAVPYIPHVVAAMLPIGEFGSAEQKQRLLPGAASGELILSAALEEALSPDPAMPATRAVKEQSGYRLHGEKFAVAFAHRAERILLSARCDEGVVAVLLDPKSAGVTLTPVKTTTYEPQCVVRLENVLVDGSDVLAGPDQGTSVMQWIAERVTVALCMHQLGVTDSMMRRTASYTSERKQFGVPIATFQAVGHRAANCFIDVECLRLSACQAASLLASSASAAVEVDIAKVWAGDVGHRVSYAAQHLHGGTGVDRDYPLWRYCLWARHNEMTLGSSAARLASLGDRCASGEALLR